MEKADILEMTIGHLIEMHQQNIGKCLYFLSGYLHILYRCYKYQMNCK